MKLFNATPFSLSVSSLPISSFRSRSAAHLRASFNYSNLGQMLVLADSQGEPPLADSYRDDPLSSSLIEPSFLHLGKPGTDLLVKGVAYAPGNAPCYRWDVKVQAPGVDNQISIFGDRYWKEGMIVSKHKRANIHMHYEYAFGGVSSDTDDPSQHSKVAHNPAGVGASRDDILLPNIEQTAQLIQRKTDAPTPAGLGPLAPHWANRYQYAGTYDARWQSTRAPFLPDDFNLLFNQAAHPAMQTKTPYTGGETITIQGMHPDSVLRFSLPNIRFASRFFIAEQKSVRRPFVLETVAINTQEETIILDWRASIDHKGGIEHIRRVEAEERR